MNGSPAHFDLIVIGSGSAGAAARKIAQAAGRSVAVIEKDKLGGDCANYACIPTKALLRSAKVYGTLKRAAEFGIRPGMVDFDWAAVLARKDRIVSETGEPAEEKKYRRQEIPVYKGTARFEDAHHIRVGDQVLHGDRIFIATGTRPQLPDILGIDEVRPLTSVQAVSLRALPQSLIILGGGVVGCEFAQLFSTFGVRVTLLQQAPEILPREEPELSGIVRQSLERNGATVLTGVKVSRVTKAGRQKVAFAEIAGESREFSADEILIATGREPNSEELNLGAAGVDTEKGHIRINEFLQTTQAHIYAGGDVTGPFLYTHFAHYQGTLAGRNMWADTPKPADYRVVPRVTFTEPELASVGLTEAQAARQNRAIVVGRADFRGLGRAEVESEETGLVKIVADAESGEILGGHIAAPTAGEMIHELVAAMAAHASLADIAGTMHAFPTFSEAVEDAAGDGLRAFQQQETDSCLTEPCIRFLP